jgi:predicted dehydrogenase
VSLVVIASRHASHAPLVVQSLAAGKAVFVEKPLALTWDELDQVHAAYQGASYPFLMVGFNRRFAPLTQRLRDFLAGADEPLLLHYRVNAGYLPPDHWTQQPNIGGGRILGEMCHFVDLLTYLVGHAPVEVAAYALPDRGRYCGDNVSAILRFPEGSVATLTYAANGDSALEKERLEVFGGGRAAVLHDFRRLTLYELGRRKEHKLGQDKGHHAEMLALIDAVERGASAPVDTRQAFQVTAVTLAIVDALSTGSPMSVPAMTLSHRVPDLDRPGVEPLGGCLA